MSGSVRTTVAVALSLWLAAGVGADRVAAQDPPGDPRPLPATPDTIPPENDPAGEGGQVEEDEPGEISPGGAFLRSLLLPGWGHAATGSHFRGAFYVATQSGALWMLAKSMAQHRQAGRFRIVEYEAARERLRIEGVERADSLHALAIADPRVEQWDERIEARSQQVEDWAALSLFLVLLGATDAFVAGHLMEHPEPLSLEVFPRPGGGWTLSGSIRPGRLPFLPR